MTKRRVYPAPRARKEGLLIKEMADEVLVYDLESYKAHCLNQMAALVWKHCDGEKSVREMAGILRVELKAPVDEEVVWLALNQLGRAKLLEDRAAHPAGKSLSRRDVMKKIGWAAAVGLPIVTSLVAPTAIQAAYLGCGDLCDPANNRCRGTCNQCTASGGGFACSASLLNL